MVALSLILIVNLIECVDGVVEAEGERYPEDIRHEERGGQFGDFSKGGDGRQDSEPEEDNFNKRAARTAQTKKDD